MRIFLLIALLLTAGCSTTVKVDNAPAPGASIPKSIALLPSEYPSTVARERVDYLRSSLQTELKNAGFIVLDERLVNSICTTPQCPERKTLASKYLVDSFASLQIDSLSRNSFLAGFYNEIAGKLRVTDADGKELVSLSASEKEKGGLLFNSGQVFQGIISQAENAKDSNSQILGDKFVRSLVSGLPTIKNGESTPSDSIAVNLASVDLKTIGSGLYQICATGTSNSSAYLLLNRERTNLRETTPGRYCSNLYLETLGAPGSNVLVELRSPFGNSVRKEVSAPAADFCSLDGRVLLEKMNASRKITIACASFAQAEASCSEKLQTCDTSKFAVYRAPAEYGPYERVAELTNMTTWVDRSASTDTGPFYQVVAVRKNGLLSLPSGPKDETTIQ